jgi:hypothetical protein
MKLKQENLWSILKNLDTYDSHTAFQFYGMKLREFWKNNYALKDLFEILSELSAKKEGKKRTIEEQFSDRSKHLPLHIFKITNLLLVETDFYEQFFTIGMVHRQEMLNSKKAAETYFGFIDKLIWKEDAFWGRWLDLYKLNFDVKVHFTETQQDSLFEEYYRLIKEKKFDNEFSKAELSNLKQLIDIDRFKKLESRFMKINKLFTLSFYLSYRAWLISKIRKSEMNDNKLPPKNRLKEIETYIDDFYEKDFIHLKESEEFYQDYLMLEIHFYGSRLIGYEADNFKNLPKELRNKLIHTGKEVLRKSELKMNRNISYQYRVWYEYYKFILAQRYAENYFMENDKQNILLYYKKALEQLIIVEDLLSGGFSRILIKVKRHYIDLYFVINHLELYFSELNLENTYRESSMDKNKIVLDENIYLISRLKGLFLED